MKSHMMGFQSSSKHSRNGIEAQIKTANSPISVIRIYDFKNRIYM